MNLQSLMPAKKLSVLLDGWAEVGADEDVLVHGVSEFSNDVTRGDLFLALVGESSHGLKYCDHAISNGAVAIAWEPDSNHQELVDNPHVPTVKVENLSAHIGAITQRCYEDIDLGIKNIAITGTDGKSSVAYLTAQILESQNQSCCMIGTLGNGRLNHLANSNHTTPPLTRICKEISKAKELGCEYIALEASSHGIVQNRLQGLSIHTAVLTNITRDHLDYHASMQEYIDAKSKLFFTHQPKNVVLNLDDEIGGAWAEDLKSITQVITYSLVCADADVYTANIEYTSAGTKLDIQAKQQSFSIEIPLLGEFNAQNMLAVSAILLSVGIAVEQLPSYLSQVTPVPGRMQLLDEKRPNVVVDYAHTPNALRAALHATKQHFSGRLICVFGCGGDRDQGKRAAMGEVAVSHADYVIITSDNPRDEDPQTIIQQIQQGCKDKTNFTVCVDRKQAIAHALQISEPNDAILIAGKGHEKYQQIKDKRIAFDDVAITSKLMGEVING